MFASKVVTFKLCTLSRCPSYGVTGLGPVAAATCAVKVPHVPQVQTP